MLHDKSDNYIHDMYMYIYLAMKHRISIINCEVYTSSSIINEPIIYLSY